MAVSLDAVFNSKYVTRDFRDVKATGTQSTLPNWLNWSCCPGPAGMSLFRLPGFLLARILSLGTFCPMSNFVSFFKQTITRRSLIAAIADTFVTREQSVFKHG